MTDFPEADGRTGTRKSRWAAAPRPVLLNNYDWALLEAVSRHQPVTLGQLSRLLGRAYKDCQRTARRLLDAQLLGVFPGPASVSRSPQNAPTLRGLTEAGARRVGGKRYAPPPAWKLDHELMARDVAAWAAESCRAANLAAPQLRYVPRLATDLVPDAVLTVPLGDRALCAIVECDRATEPARQWREKALKYARLLAAPDLTAVIGRRSARLLVVCPDLPRCAWVEALLGEAGVAAWFAPQSLLAGAAFGSWRVTGGGERLFLPPDRPG